MFNLMIVLSSAIQSCVATHLLYRSHFCDAEFNFLLALYCPTQHSVPYYIVDL